jgi:hypothetical protein
MKLHVHFLLALVLCLCCSLTGWSQAKPDLVIFDENDSIGATYYDASFGFARAPSQITGSGPGADKIPILTGNALRGNDSGLLEWRSMAEGEWLFFVASPGWQTRNASGYSNLVLHLNGPAAIAPSHLPRIGLESSTNIRTPTVALSDYLPAGLDGDADTWQEVTVPLEDFQPYGGFQLSHFKALLFSQSSADGSFRTVWFDNLRLSAGDPGIVGPAPEPPTGVVTRTGDRSVVLHWDRREESQVAGYHVYRSPFAQGPWEKLTTATVTSPSYADLGVLNQRRNFYRISAVGPSQVESDLTDPVLATPRPFANDEEFLDYVQQTAFAFFWYEANPANGLVRDRSQPYSAGSIAATGFGLTAIAIAVERGWITREAGLERTLTTLRTFWDQPQGPESTGQIGYRGWFYHFLEMDSATRAGTSELSSIDTALLLAGMLDARQFFNAPTPEEGEIRSLVEEIFNRVDWHWMTNEGDSLTMGWMPETGFLGARWIGYNEAMILYLLGMGAAQDPLPAEQWDSWTSGYVWANHYGHSYVQFPPLFGHQYSHLWVDFRHIADAYMMDKGITYFENSRRATLAQQAYCIDNPGGFTGYSDRVWGLTASDGPGVEGFFSYIARGAPPPENDDGTIAPTAVGGSLPFAPEHCLPTLRHFYDEYRTRIWTGYGFRDAFNLSVDWWGADILGIDQGPILIMAENYRNQSVWRRFARDPIIQRGLQAAGFTRLDSVNPTLELPSDRTEATLRWSSIPGRSYQVEYSPDLTRWFISTDGPVTATGDSSSWIDPGPPATDRPPVEVPRRFYRAFQFGVPHRAGEVGPGAQDVIGWYDIPESKDRR